MHKKEHSASNHEEKKRSEYPLFMQEEEATLSHNSSPPKIDKEIGGPLGLEPTRYGDWERNGRCSDF